MNASFRKFYDRRPAGRMLAAQLEHYRQRPDLLVLALPRGGVPVAYEVAHALDALLDVFLVRKLGFPGQEEVAMGAIASGGVRVMNPMPETSIAPQAITRVVAREEVELERREAVYRGSRPAISIEGRTVIVVDDGMATGASMLAAVTGIRQKRPAHLAVAVPVGSLATSRALEEKADVHMPGYGKVARVVVVGNEDGACHVCAEVFQALVDVGFTVPASASTYWVGEAMGSVHYADLKRHPTRSLAPCTPWPC